MRIAARNRLPSLLLLALLACSGGDPTGPSGTRLTVNVLGLPSGASAAVSVSGPNGYSQPVSSSQTLTQLTPGSYTITASNVTVASTSYTASPPTQTVSVTQSSTTSTSVTYTQTTGNLTVTINGLGTASTAAVTVTGPVGSGYAQPVAATTTLSGLDPGTYTVTARDTMGEGGTSFTAAPASQTVTVSVQTPASRTVTYSPPPHNGTVNFHVAGMYLTQSAQNYAGSVPLVKNRDGFLRVFVVADRIYNTVPAVPAVQVRLWNGAVLQSTITIPPPSGMTTVPTVVDESSLGYSWNTLVSGTFVQTGLRIEAEVDPAPGIVLETDEGDNVLAPPGPLNVQAVPQLDVTFVPVIQRGNGLQGSVTPARADSFLMVTKKMHPIDAVNAIIHAPYTTSTALTLQNNNANGAWGTILGEIDALRRAESSPRYYYGVARVSYFSGVAGVAYVSVPGTTPGMGARAALGWDYLGLQMTGSTVAAHELGHNWARNHAPCGGPAPSSIDAQYPQDDGSTAGYGVDVSTQTLEPPSTGDIMGYCDPKWISDYTYQGVLNYLLAPSPPALSSVASKAIQPCLLVWGHIHEGELVLEPAFQVNTRPSLPARPGPYSLEARADDGSSVFGFSFTPDEVADGQISQQNFVFAVPLSTAGADRLSSLRVAGQGKEAVAKVQAGSGADSVQVRRVSGGRLGLRWNAATHPMVMVRDPDTGEVLSFARGGDVEVATSKTRVDLVVSNGVKSHAKRMRVTR
jgi:hypothetical protein